MSTHWAGGAGGGGRCKNCERWGVRSWCHRDDVPWRLDVPLVVVWVWVCGGGGLARGHGVSLFAFGGRAHSDPLWVRTCFGCGAPMPETHSNTGWGRGRCARPPPPPLRALQHSALCPGGLGRPRLWGAGRAQGPSPLPRRQRSSPSGCGWVEGGCQQYSTSGLGVGAVVKAAAFGRGHIFEYWRRIVELFHV